jgi:hypothetical protein
VPATAGLIQTSMYVNSAGMSREKAYQPATVQMGVPFLPRLVKLSYASRQAPSMSTVGNYALKQSLTNGTAAYSSWRYPCFVMFRGHTASQ